MLCILIRIMQIGEIESFPEWEGFNLLRHEIIQYGYIILQRIMIGR